METAGGHWIEILCLARFLHRQSYYFAVKVYLKIMNWELHFYVLVEGQMN